MICSTLSGKLAIKHPEYGVLCREDGYVFRHYMRKKGQPYEWTPGTLRKDGYYHIQVCSRTHSFKLVHRLIAECFLPNPEHKPTVDHIDRNPANNMVSPICNLRWATQHEQNLNAKKYLERRDYEVCAFEDKRAYGRLQSRDYYRDHREEVKQRQKEFRARLTGPELEAYRQRVRDYCKKYREKLKSRRAGGTSSRCPDSTEDSQSV